MNLEVIGAAVAVVGALLWIRRDMRHDIGELRRDLNGRVEELRRDLTAQIAAVNTRIDNILLADRKPPPIGRADTAPSLIRPILVGSFVGLSSIPTTENPMISRVF